MVSVPLHTYNLVLTTVKHADEGDKRRSKQGMKDHTVMHEEKKLMVSFGPSQSKKVHSHSNGGATCYRGGRGGGGGQWIQSTWAEDRAPASTTSQPARPLMGVRIRLRPTLLLSCCATANRCQIKDTICMHAQRLPLPTMMCICHLHAQQSPEVLQSHAQGTLVWFHIRIPFTKTFLVCFTIDK